MTTSQKNTIVSQIEGDNPIPAGAMAYLCARARNRYFDYVLSRFREAEKRGLTKARLARRIGKKPDRVSHMLGAPGNWTLDTATELLVGICREEITPASEPLLGRAPRNMTPVDLLPKRNAIQSPPEQRSSLRLYPLIEEDQFPVFGVIPSPNAPSKPLVSVQ